MRYLVVPAFLLLSACSAHACVVGDLAEPPGIAIASAPANCCYGEWAGSITGTATHIETDSVMVVLYAETDLYYIQPGAGAGGMTPVSCPGGDFTNMTRGGARYCAILARRSWNPPATMTSLPSLGGAVLAIACSGNTPGGARRRAFMSSRGVRMP